MNKQGFTLIELLVDVAVISILFTIVLSVSKESPQSEEANFDCEKNLEVKARFFPKECIEFLKNYNK